MKPSISDLRKLRIKKVKDYKVLFTYNNKEYLLLSEKDGDSCLMLFERVKVKDNRYVLEHIANAITCLTPSDLIRDISKKKPKNITYCNIDREYFVKTLVECNLVTGKYNDKYREVQNKVDILQEEIRILQKQISSIYMDWRKTSKHGSKCYGDGIKIQQAERISGASSGEWCEEYNEHYGHVHPIYGGTLTDLFSLPVGTTFYCTNGCWSGIISFNNKGNKTVLNDAGEYELTDSYHSVYIQ